MQAKIGRTALSSDMLKKLVFGKTVDWCEVCTYFSGL